MATNLVIESCMQPYDCSLCTVVLKPNLNTNDSLSTNPQGWSLESFEKSEEKLVPWIQMCNQSLQTKTKVTKVSS